MELGRPDNPHTNKKWVALCRAFTALGRAMTGLPIDFQIQQQTWANEKYAEQKREGLFTVWDDRDNKDEEGGEL